MHELAPLKVGVLACGRYVHTRGIWGAIIHPERAEGQPFAQTRATRMVLSHTWDVDREKAAEFAHHYPEVEVVDHFGDMVGQVDGVILDDFDSCLHFKELARPYLEAGIPMFINRPFALNLADARALIELARRHEAPIMCASTFEFAPEIEHIRRELAAAAPLSGYVAANSMSDYATHGIHGLFFVHACVGGGIRSVSYQTPDWKNPNGVVIIEHEGRDGGRPFYGCVQQIQGPWAWIKGFGKQTVEQSVLTGDYFWLPLVLEMQKMFETRKMPQSYETLYEKTQLFLAGFMSHLERGGAPVTFAEIGDWGAPRLNPDPYPEGYFGCGNPA